MNLLLEALALAISFEKLWFVLRAHLLEDFAAHLVLGALEFNFEPLDFKVELLALGIPPDLGILEFLLPLVGGFAGRRCRTRRKLAQPFQNGSPRRLFPLITRGAGGCFL